MASTVEKRSEETSLLVVKDGPNTSKPATVISSGTVTSVTIETVLREMKHELEQAKLDKLERERYLKLKEEQIQELQKRWEEKENSYRISIENAKLMSVKEEDTLMKEKDKENDKLRNKLKKFTIEIFDAEDRIKVKQKIINEQKKIINEQSDTIVKLEGKIINLTEKLVNLTDEVHLSKEELKRSNANLTFKQHIVNSTKTFEALSLSTEKEVGHDVVDWEEEKLVLTRQVHAYSDQCDELKRKLQDAHDRYTQEIERLNTELQSTSHYSSHCASLSCELKEERGRVRQLSIQLTTEQNNKESLTIKIDELRARMYEANRVLKEKVDSLEAKNARLCNEKRDMQQLIQSSSTYTPVMTRSVPTTTIPIITLQQDPEDNIRSTNNAFNKLQQEGPDKRQQQNEIPRVQDTIVQKDGQCTLLPTRFPPRLPPSFREPQMNDDSSANNTYRYLSSRDNVGKGSHEQGIGECLAGSSGEFYSMRRSPPRVSRVSPTATIMPTPSVLHDDNSHIHDPPAMSENEIIRLFKDRKKCSSESEKNNEKTPSQSKNNSCSSLPSSLPNRRTEQLDEKKVAQWVYDQSRRPTTAEVEADSDEESTLPYYPNLICPKCGKRYHIGGIQLFKRHVTELCPLLEK